MESMGGRLNQFKALGAPIRFVDSEKADEFSQSSAGNLSFSLAETPQENPHEMSRRPKAAKAVKPQAKKASQCLSHQTERPKRSRKPAQSDCCEKSEEGLAIASAAVAEYPSNCNTIDRGGDRNKFQATDPRLSQQNSLDEGPLSFSQLLAQDSQNPNPDAALYPDTPMLMYHTPPALKKLLAQSSPANPPEAPVPIKRPRMSETGRMSAMSSEQTQPRAESSCREETVRAQIVACLLDPNFQDLLTDVEKVWRDLEVSMSEDGQLVQAVANYFKDAGKGARSWQQQSRELAGIPGKEPSDRDVFKK